jgi:hypothetical protein
VQSFFYGTVAGALISGILVLAWRLRRRGDRRPTARATSVQSFVTSMRAVGELSVFRIMTKEVISTSDHWFGEFGKKYLSWLFSSKHMTLIIEFDVEFRYDLTDPVFRVGDEGGGRVALTLPPCKHEILIRDMQIHSEGKTEFLPWLMPDLLGRFFTGGFSVEAKNRLIAETRLEASRFARALVQRATGEAQASAVRTLTMLCRGLGATDVRVEFLAAEAFAPDVDTSRLETAAEPRR